MRIHRLLGLCLLGMPVLAGAPCEPVEGLAPLIEPGRVLLLGEIHGTEESPAFAGEVACHAAAAGLPVRVGLELLEAEQPRIDDYLGSGGALADRTALLAGPTWRDPYQDGRNSRAMAALIERVRMLRRTGADVGVVAFDARPPGGGQQRDRAMADNLARSIAASPEALTVVLAGNRHSRVTRGVPRQPEYEPMGYLLGRRASFDGRIVALKAGHGAGSAWICNRNCGVVRIGGSHGRLRNVVDMDDTTRPAGYQGWYHVGTSTASAPARMSAEEAAALVIPAPPAPAEDGPPMTPTETEPDLASGTEWETKLQGAWHAFDFGSKYKTWELSFEGGRFRAESGEDDWYAGRVTLRPDRKPAEIDFLIEDCRCTFKGQTSEGIYYWDDESLVVCAPTPGSPRPGRFVENSGQTLRLRRPASTSPVSPTGE